MKTLLYWLVALHLFSGCEPHTGLLDANISPHQEETDPALLSEGFYTMFDTFKAALISKNWQNLYSYLRIEEKKYFPTVGTFVDYMKKGTKLWELHSFKILSKKIDIFDEAKTKVEVYFYAEILPGPTKHYGSLVFIKRQDTDWSVLNLELLRLPIIQFQE